MRILQTHPRTQFTRNKFANQTPITCVSEDEIGNVMAWPNNEKIRYDYFFPGKNTATRDCWHWERMESSMWTRSGAILFPLLRFLNETSDVIYLTPV